MLGIVCLALPHQAAHMCSTAQLPTPGSGLQRRNLSSAEMELEIRVRWYTGKGDTRGCNIPTQIFLSSLKLNPWFGHPGCSVNLMGYFRSGTTAHLSSGTTAHLSSARSFLLGWEGDSAPLEERRFKVMKSPQPTPVLYFFFKGRGQ